METLVLALDLVGALLFAPLDVVKYADGETAQTETDTDADADTARGPERDFIRQWAAVEFRDS